MAKNFIKSDSAVSEVVGFILVFSIIMLAIGVIYAVGYPCIQSSKKNTQFQNTEQSFMVLQSDIKMVAFDQAPVKTLKTSLGGGSLTVNSSKGHIKVENATGTIWYDDTIGVIEYEKNGRSIAYEGGGVWEKYPVGSALKLSEPRIFAHNTSTGIRTVFVSIINISSDLSSVGGEGTASVVARLNRSHTPDITYSPGNVTKSFDTVTAKILYDTLVVNEHVIEVEVS